MIKSIVKPLGLVVFIGVALMGCATTASTPVDNRNSMLTTGVVQTNIQIGVTTKADILDTFGGPNIATVDGVGREVWSYQRAGTVAQSEYTSGYWTLVLAGQSKEAAGFSQSSRMMTLIIKFDKNGVVHDFKSKESNF